MKHIQEIYTGHSVETDIEPHNKFITQTNYNTSKSINIFGWNEDWAIDFNREALVAVWTLKGTKHKRDEKVTNTTIGQHDSVYEP